MVDVEKVDWFKGVFLVVWVSWIVGMVLGGIVGDLLV